MPLNNVLALALNLLLLPLEQDKNNNKKKDLVAAPVLELPVLPCIVINLQQCLVVEASLEVEAALDLLPEVEAVVKQEKILPPPL